MPDQAERAIPRGVAAAATIFGGDVVPRPLSERPISAARPRRRATTGPSLLGPRASPDHSLGLTGRADRSRRGVPRKQRDLQPNSVVRRKAYEKLLEEPCERRRPSGVRKEAAIQGGQSGRLALPRGEPWAVYDSGGCARRPTRA